MVSFEFEKAEFDLIGRFLNLEMLKNYKNFHYFDGAKNLY